MSKDTDAGPGTFISNNGGTAYIKAKSDGSIEAIVAGGKEFSLNGSPLGGGGVDPTITVGSFATDHFPITVQFSPAELTRVRAYLSVNAVGTAPYADAVLDEGNYGTLMRNADVTGLYDAEFITDELGHLEFTAVGAAGFTYYACIDCGGKVYISSALVFPS